MSRNFFGSQVQSFETELRCPPCFAALEGAEAGAERFRAVFIRAPAVVSWGAGVEVLAEYAVPQDRPVPEPGVSSVAVAVRQGSLLGTAFHPELTEDTRWHRLFLSMCRTAAAAPAGQ